MVFDFFPWLQNLFYIMLRIASKNRFDYTNGGKLWKRDNTSFCWQEQSSEQIPASYLADWILCLHVAEDKDLLLVLSESCIGCLCSACLKGWYMSQG